MNSKQALQAVFSENWYAQSANVTPLFIMGAADFVFSMLQEPAGIAYTHFVYMYEGYYGKFCYGQSDLERLNRAIGAQLSVQPDFLQRVRENYREEQRPYQEFFAEIEDIALDAASTEKLWEYAKRGVEGLGHSVGRAHIIEPFTLLEDTKIRERLSKYVSDERDLNTLFIALSTPEEKSFLQEAHEAQKAVRESADRERALQEFRKRFFWIRNSYVGRAALTDEEILEAPHAVHPVPKGTDDRSVHALCERYAVPDDVLRDFSRLRFTAGWQDERKKNILIAIDYLDRIVEALAKRLGISHDSIKYAFPRELKERTLPSETELQERKEGLAIYAIKEREYMFFGEERKKILAWIDGSVLAGQTEIRGVVASGGTVTGTVAVCTTLASLDKIRQGDILVVSMTRPEYLPAMKKAAAFVTDEGGITCHAAIVAREMGKPCVIGTKTATRVLKDGDMVEVDANKGIVKALKRR